MENDWDEYNKAEERVNRYRAATGNTGNVFCGLCVAGGIAYMGGAELTFGSALTVVAVVGVVQIVAGVRAMYRAEAALQRTLEATRPSWSKPGRSFDATPLGKLDQSREVFAPAKWV